MPPPPPVSSTRTATTLRPGLSTPMETGYFRAMLYPTVVPTFTPLTQVVSMSSTIPSCNSAVALAARAGVVGKEPGFELRLVPASSRFRIRDQRLELLREVGEVRQRTQSRLAGPG